MKKFNFTHQFLAKLIDNTENPTQSNEIFYYRAVHYTAGLDPMPQHASSHSEVARYLKVWETVWGTKFL